MADLTSVASGAAAQDRAAIDSGLAAIVLVARFHGIAVDPDGLRHQFGTANRPFSIDQILRAAKLLNLKARALDSDWAVLVLPRASGRLRIPCAGEVG